MIDRERRERRLRAEIVIREPNVDGDWTERTIPLRELADRLHELERGGW
jgi:hypothetical protein